MQNRRNSNTLAALVACVGALAGPSASAQTISQPETYQLAEIAGSALPAVIEDEEGCREEIIGATLTLNTDGSWTLISRERETCGAGVEEDEEKEDGMYRIEGDAIRFLDEDGDEDDAEDDDEEEDDEDSDIDLEDLMLGARSADGMVVQLKDGETVLVFRR